MTADCCHNMTGNVTGRSVINYRRLNYFNLIIRYNNLTFLHLWQLIYRR